MFFFNQIKGLKEFIFLFAMLLVFSQLKTDSGNTNSTKLVFEKRYKTQLENFSFLIKMIDYPDESSIYSTASGSVFSSSNSHIFILTAHHFCFSDDEMTDIFGTSIIAMVNQTPRLVNVIFIDEKNDLCVLSGIKYKNEKFKKLKFATKMPSIGSYVFNVAAPDSMGSENTRLLFDGYFAGCEDDIICLYTLPATFGSSGSLVYNEKGEIISVLVMANPSFENVAMGPNIYIINNFINDIKKAMDIE